MKQNKTRENIDGVADILTTLNLLGIKSEVFNNMLDKLPVCLWMHDKKHTIVYGNSGFKENFSSFHKRTCHQCVMEEENCCSCCPSENILKIGQSKQCKLCKRGHFGYDLNIVHIPVTNKYGQKFVLKSSLHIKNFDILPENYFSETQNSDREEFFLVMCASCKKVRDQDNNWVSVDNHIIDQFNVSISHGLCEECVGILPHSKYTRPASYYCTRLTVDSTVSFCNV